MKVKNSFWALAFALMAVSCSDDIEGGPDGNNGQEMNGAKAYVKVAINTGVETKAPTSEGSQGGEGEGTELGSDEEYRVSDVTLILFDNKDNATATEEEKEGFNFLAGSNIRGVGYAKIEEQGSSAVTQHSWAATVQVEMDEDESQSLFDNKYGVIAVTNLGENSVLYQTIKKGDEGLNGTTIKTGKGLADCIMDYQTKGVGFIMSTHAMKWGLSDKATPTESVVEVEPSNNENDAPVVNVFVERLAAKIRISKAENIDNFIYQLPKTGTAIAKVRLDEVAVVNQLSSGTYLLKRVSENNPTAFTTEMNVIYMGDEIWDDTENAEKYNYVMDPWIVNRNVDAGMPVIPVQLKYTNQFGSTQGQNYKDMFNTYTNAMDLSTATTESFNESDGKAIRLAYTHENVTQKEHSLNGYSTGALFKATYFPDKLTKVASDGISTEAGIVSYDGQDGANASELSSVDQTSAGKSFYEYNGSLYETQEAIFIDRVNNTTTDKQNHNYNKFKDGFNEMTIEEYENYFSHMIEPFGYIRDLNDKVADYKKQNPNAKLNETKMSELNDAKNFNSFMADKSNKTIGDAKFYESGVCYYPYWIRHANNGKASVMGIMEFAIVRNNIYDLTVEGMKTLGFSGTDVPDPTDPDEDGTARINVNLYVKNWVVRSNGSIIL